MRKLFSVFLLATLINSQPGVSMEDDSLTYSDSGEDEESECLSFQKDESSNQEQDDDDSDEEYQNDQGKSDGDTEEHWLIEEQLLESKKKKFYKKGRRKYFEKHPQLSTTEHINSSKPISSDKKHPYRANRENRRANTRKTEAHQSSLSPKHWGTCKNSRVSPQEMSNAALNVAVLLVVCCQKNRFSMH